MKSCVFVAAMLLSSAALAGQTDAIHTCYDKSIQSDAAALDTELFVAIDQTTLLDQRLKQLVADNIKPFLSPNMGFAILIFSAIHKATIRKY